MSYPKITVNTGLAIQVIASDSLPIPNPDLQTLSGTASGLTTGTATANVVNTLEDNSADFESAVLPLPVLVGDYAFEISSGNSAAVTVVLSATELTLASDVFPLGNEAYAIIRENTLVDIDGLFSDGYGGTGPVTVGDIVYNTTANTSAVVASVSNNTTIGLNADIFGSSVTYNDSYKIFMGGVSSLVAVDPQQGCLLYVGSNDSTMTVGDSYVDVRVKTVSGSIVTFTNFPVGEYLPIQVLNLYSTGTSAAAANNCIAIW